MRLSVICLLPLLWLHIQCLALPQAATHPSKGIRLKREQLYQDIVTWDPQSLMINGERLLIFSGEFHPFRLPVPSLWLDVFQKIKAAGFNAVSFYAHWALLEGKQGDFSAQGVFDFEPFFQAATKAGVYLIARPGPYINAESTGGGMPGWIQRFPGHVRYRTPYFMNASQEYIGHIGSIVAGAQITNGGPVILVQPENEYSHVATGFSLDPYYMQDVEDYYRQSGIIMPFISNDGFEYGNFVPGSGPGAVDIYGHDSYPLGFNCANTTDWTAEYFPTNFSVVHYEQSPSTPYAISEFQAGSLDSWGGSGFDNCAAWTGPEYERVFYKNDYSFGVKILNLYMTYGGTNWGNLGYPYGYTSYDYGSAIREDRMVVREKYSEVKLQLNFLSVSPAYIVATVYNFTNNSYTDNPAITVSPVKTNTTGFWVVRHSDFRSMDPTEYSLTLPTSDGLVSIPQLGGSLTLNGRDSKIHVTDYPVGSFEILYSTAEIFTWKDYGSKTVLILYGGPNETHEIALQSASGPQILEGGDIFWESKPDQTVLQWQTSSNRRIIRVDGHCQELYIHILDRNTAYDYWVLHLPGGDGSAFNTATSVIIKGGYLWRTASVEGSTLSLAGDLNATAQVELVGAPQGVERLRFNGVDVDSQTTPYATITALLKFVTPSFQLPDLTKLEWKLLDSLPEIQATYDDSPWVTASNTYTNNTTIMNLTTPTSLFASDYGFNTASVIYRGHFIANGLETNLSIWTQGGDGFGHSIWLNSTFLQSWVGKANALSVTQNMALPNLTAGASYVFTIVIDLMGNEENTHIGDDSMKTPRGILGYNLTGHAASDITWKLTGNLGGEDYRDRTRGPLNEGSLYAERQGYHLPNPPSQNWRSAAPTEGIAQAGIGFYATNFELDMPEGYDIPLSFAFPNISSAANYRCQLYVNGYQFGKYVHNLGPQTAFPVPEGILNYHGINYIALTLWSLDSDGANVSIGLEATGLVQSAYGPVELSPMTEWTVREGAY